MVYLDLDELPPMVDRGGLIGCDRHASRAFLRSDHLFRRTGSLSREVRELVETESGIRPEGPIRLLTQLRYFGFYFSPLNIFYVYDEADTTVDFVVAEVNNTPWNERHCYVLWDGNRTSSGLQFSHPKAFHVSPFMGMDMQYRWQFTAPDSNVTVNLDNIEETQKLFEARLELKRHELSRRQIRQMVLRYPLMTGKIIAAIYYQAWKLWWKKCPFYTHPKNHSPSVNLPRTSPKLLSHRAGVIAR